jgi:hypothetical protein
MKKLICVGALLALVGCDSTKSDTGAKQTTAATSKPSATTSATASATATAAAAAPGIETFGGKDWKAVYQGEPLMELTKSRGGGQGTGMADDHTFIVGTARGQEGWKYGAINRGGIHWSASKKIAIVENYNIKMDPQQKTIDTWIKSALVKDVKHTAGPEVIEVGPKKGLALAGAGTCAMKDGSAADFYWRDLYSAGDFSHKLAIFVVSKDAPEEEKKVALSALRDLEFTDKLKPHYKKKL